MSEPSQERGNAIRKAVFLLRAKANSRTQAYSCFLDEQPTEWIPRRARQGLNPPADDVDLIVNPSFRFQLGGDPPDALRQRTPLLDGFLRGYPIAWVEDPGTGIWTPFWARGDWIETLQSLRPELSIPSDLSPSVRHTLVMANILVARGYEQAQRAQWQAVCESAKSQYHADGYVVVRDLIHPLQLGAMRRYYRALVADGRLPLGDSQVSERYGLHSEVLASFFHPQLTNLVSRIAGEPVKPSYLYFASYRPGAVLPKHVDREQCEFSISLLADYVPEPDGPCGWPLYMENPTAPEVVHAADLSVGDALLYRGRELIHYRHPLPDGHQSTSVFLHYVREDFSGSLS